jgi:hypothetical protein
LGAQANQRPAALAASRPALLTAQMCCMTGGTGGVFFWRAAEGRRHSGLFARHSARDRQVHCFSRSTSVSTHTCSPHFCLLFEFPANGSLRPQHALQPVRPAAALGLLFGLVVEGHTRLKRRLFRGLREVGGGGEGLALKRGRYRTVSLVGSPSDTVEKSKKRGAESNCRTQQAGSLKTWWL